MRLIPAILGRLFHLLYHAFAWAYDLVAAAVSLGQWKGWVLAALPYVEGRRVLELGCGPGHLQQAMRGRSLVAFGLDESRPMSRLAAKNLKRNGCAQINLTRGLTQALPFPAGAFETVVATFPSEYIFDPRTLAEVHRALSAGGRLVVLPFAWITGRRLLERLLAWLFRLTGEAPDPVGVLSAQMKKPFLKAGFAVSVACSESKSSVLLFVLARKSRL